MAIPFVDLARLHTAIRSELDQAFSDVMAASAFTLGEHVDRFEDEFAGYVSTSECVGVSSGTAALTIMLKAAGIGTGDEVIVPAHTFIASAIGVVDAGATPVYCDVLDDTGLIDPAAAEAAITERTAAILAVHLYGQACDMDALVALAERKGIALFEDAAQAHGATYRGRRVGSFGRAAAFSFYPSKNLGALGDGGAITTSDAELADRGRQFRNLGQRAKYDHVRIAANDRLDGLQAAFLRVKLPHLDEWNASRRQAAAVLRKGLAGTFACVEERDESPSIHHLFPIRTADRDAVAASLADDGIATGIHYSPAVHLQPPLQAIADTSEGDFPVAEAWAREELSLPMFPFMHAEELERIVESCRTAAAHLSTVDVNQEQLAMERT